jgi:uncharacterized protein (DUF58 family)
MVGLLILTLVTDTPELVPLVVVVGLPLVMAPWSALLRGRRARAGLAVTTVATPAMTAVGGEMTVRIRVTNRLSRRSPALSISSPEPRWRFWRGDASVPPGSTPSVRRRLVIPSGFVALPALAPHASAAYTRPVPTQRRGVFVLRAERGWVVDPFGLCGVPGPTVPAVTVVVHPEPDPLVEWPEEGGNDPLHETTVASHGHGRDGPGELVGIRPYVAGDRLSLLHWASRARYGAWFVRQFAPELGWQSRLVLDDRAGVHRRADFERMLSTAEGLVEHCWQGGRTIELRTMSGKSTILAPAALALEEARVLLASLLPGTSIMAVGAGDGTVLTTATGARSLPDTVDRIVVGP